MFSQKIIDDDMFLSMPLSAQALYFHLCMRADDDGFVDSPRKIQRLISCSDDDFRLLIAKSYILTFNSGVIVIRHWKIHNYIQKDRYKSTSFLKEKNRLDCGEDGVYIISGEENSAEESQMGLPIPAFSGKQMVPEPAQVLTAPALNVGNGQEQKAKTKAVFVPPTVEEIQKYNEAINSALPENKKIIFDYQYFVDYWETRNWYLKKGLKMSSWKGAVRTWRSNQASGQYAEKPGSSKKGEAPAAYRRFEDYDT